MPQSPFGYQRRNSLRYLGYDYSRSGAYFVTICTHRGRAMFGQVIDHDVALNPLGQIANSAWQELADRRPNIDVDAHVIMPNHVHVLLWLATEPELVGRNSTDQMRKFGDAIAGSLSSLVGAYKSAVTQKARNRMLVSDSRLWQRNFYDHIVRSDADALRIRDYIRANPARWLDDQLHPDALPNRFNRSWRE